MQAGTQARRGRRARGQSTLEYILVIAAVLLAILAAVVKVLTPAVDKTVTDSGSIVNRASAQLGNRFNFGP